MALWIDRKYVSIFGSQYLERYSVKKESPFLSVCRCIVCGDSKKNPYRTRGYFYQADDAILYKCHNCNHSTSLSKMIQTYAPNLYEEYRLETFKENQSTKEIEPFKAEIDKFSSRRIDHFDPFKGIKKISQLPETHPAKKYIVSRKVPSRQHYRMYYVNKFFTWVNSFVPDKFSEKSLQNDHGRIVFPFINANGYCFGFTGRSINKNSTLRYSTIMLDEKENKIFGLDQLDRKEKIIVVEGPIDSLFIRNSVAMAGTDVNLEQIASRENMIIVLDNQPRNKEVVAKIEKLVYDAYTVCIFPENIKGKDINDFVLNGMKLSEVRKMIFENSYSGLEAQLKFANWKKI